MVCTCSYSHSVILTVHCTFSLDAAIATGKIGNVPYCEKNRIKLVGLPKSIDFKRPSLYGVKQLRTIITNKDKFEMHGKFKPLCCKNDPLFNSTCCTGGACVCVYAHRTQPHTYTYVHMHHINTHTCSYTYMHDCGNSRTASQYIDGT